MISKDTMQALLSFRRERDWEQFHSPKNLAIAISTEAAELLEEFRWTSSHDLDGDVSRHGVECELADVVILALYLAHDLGVDLDDLLRRKMQINASRYPVSSSRGRPRPASGG